MVCFILGLSSNFQFVFNMSTKEAIKTIKKIPFLQRQKFDSIFVWKEKKG